MGQKILGISGKKQSGKDTCYKFLHQLLTKDEHFPSMSLKIGRFYFAEPLKRMCVDILGCPKDKVYGTDEDKNTPVPHLLWGNFPLIVTKSGKTLNHRSTTQLEMASYFKYDGRQRKYVVDSTMCKSGPMTVREVLQYWGTEIFRKQYGNVWADACIRAINMSGVELAVVCDCRFPNELNAICEAGGNVIRLTRKVSDDKHASETALDPDIYDWTQFSGIINNKEFGVADTCRHLYELLVGWKMINEVPTETVQDCIKLAVAA